MRSFTTLSQLLLLGFLFTFSNGYDYFQPEQVHISFRIHPEEMYVTWVTFNSTPESIVEYGRDKLTDWANGTVTKFVDGGSEKRVLYVHRVLLTGLLPGTTYRYHCGSSLGWSPVFWFTTMKVGAEWSPRLAIYGDMGNVNAQSLPRLQEDVLAGMYDAILHVGDFAYDMDTDNARVGDEFMRQIEPIAAYVPYMVCPGNHEIAYNFSNYYNRFTMTNLKGDMNNHYFSLNVGPIHFLFFSSEFYYWDGYGGMLQDQYNWILEDLKEATSPVNRSVRPWIITLAHRPMYCSTKDQDDCKKVKNRIRVGLPNSFKYGLEEIFYKYGVDIEIWAHEHTYERTWPLYNYTVYNGSVAEPYKNPKAPVHLITGSSGCQERVDPFVQNPPEWSAFRSSDYGYTRLTAINRTHLYFEQVSDDKHGQIIDKIWLIKDSHAPYV